MYSVLYLQIDTESNNMIAGHIDIRPVHFGIYSTDSIIQIFDDFGYDIGRKYFDHNMFFQKFKDYSNHFLLFYISKQNYFCNMDFDTP